MDLDSANLRAMTQNDVAAVWKIEQAAQVSPWSKKIFHLNLTVPAHYSWVLEKDREILAFLVMSVVLEDSHLLNVCVAPQAQQQGIGRYLLTFAMAQARQQGAKKMFLEVRVSNYAAVHLYEQFGFEKTRLRQDYYGTAQGREDGQEYVKQIAC